MRARYWLRSEAIRAKPPQYWASTARPCTASWASPTRINARTNCTISASQFSPSTVASPGINTSGNLFSQYLLDLRGAPARQAGHAGLVYVRRCSGSGRCAAPSAFGFAVVHESLLRRVEVARGADFYIADFVQRTHILRHPRRRLRQSSLGLTVFFLQASIRFIACRRA